MQTLQCTSCNAPLEIDEYQTVIHCQYCGATIDRPQQNSSDSISIQIPGKNISIQIPKFENQEGNSSTQSFSLGSSRVVVSSQTSSYPSAFTSKVSVSQPRISSPFSSGTDPFSGFSQSTAGIDSTGSFQPSPNKRLVTFVVIVAILAAIAALGTLFYFKPRLVQNPQSSVDPSAPSENAVQRSPQQAPTRSVQNQKIPTSTQSLTY